SESGYALGSPTLGEQVIRTTDTATKPARAPVGSRSNRRTTRSTRSFWSMYSADPSCATISQAISVSVVRLRSGRQLPVVQSHDPRAHEHGASVHHLPTQDGVTQCSGG